MYAKLFADAGHLLALPAVALILFIAVFVGVFIKAMRKKPKELDALAALPLVEEDRS